MSAPFDTAALRQWKDVSLLSSGTLIPIPKSLWNQLRADLVAAADEIDRLQQLVKEEA